MPAIAMQTGDCSFERVSHCDSLPESTSNEVAEFHNLRFQLRKRFSRYEEPPEHCSVFEPACVEPVGQAGIGVGEDHSPRTVGIDLGLHPIK